MSLFAPAGGKAAKFPQIGASITGKIAQMPFEKQATKFGSQDLDFWPNGDPKMDIVVPLEETNAPREDGNDDGDRTIYVSSKNMRQAIAQAIQASGQSDVAIGGTLSVTYVADDPNSKNPANPAKLYQAQYSAPATGFAQPQTQPPAAAQVAPAPAPATAAGPAPATYQTPAPAYPAAPAPAPAPAPVPGFNALPVGVSQEQADKAKQLLAINTDIAVITTALGLTPEQVAHIQNGTF